TAVTLSVSATRAPPLSSLLLHETDEDVFERALRRLEILENDSGVAQPVEQSHDAGSLAFRIVRIRQLGAAVCELKVIRAEWRRKLRQRLLQLQRQPLLAKLLHQLDLVLHEDDRASADHADSVGHLFGLVDVMRRQDDRHSGVSQRA